MKYLTTAMPQHWTMLRVLNVESIKLYMRQHTAELAIVAVMIGISVGIAFATGGDVGEALARKRR